MESSVVDYRRAQRSALLWMLAGSTAVLFLLTTINALDSSLPERKVSQITEFEVKRDIKQERKVERKPEPKPRQDQPPPPLPSSLLNSDLAGLNLGLLAFSLDEMGGVDKSLLGDTSDVIMSGDMVDVAPRPKLRTPVEYPARAKAKEIEGYVVLSLLIDKEGRVSTVKVLEAEPAGIFDQPAIRTVKGWQFEPARYKGEPVQTWANQTIRFQLG